MESPARAASGSTVEEGEAALRHAAWAEARHLFESALAEAETPAAFAGLGAAARAQFDGETALAAHEQGYRLARELGDDRAAARLALELAFDAGVFRGPAEAAGWVARAGHLLEQVPGPSEEHGILTYFRANLALRSHDPGTARALAAEAAAMARAGGSVDGEMISLALEGLALVAGGEVDSGMRLLDEAATAALAGEVGDARVVEVICCHLIAACERVRDFDRAGEWCRRVEEIATRYGDAEMFARCRIQYGEVLVWRGAWKEAEETLTAVCRDFAKVRLNPADALVRLAELRRRQGRLEESSALVAEARDHPLAGLVDAALALARGDAADAAAAAARALRRVGADDHFARVPALELVVRARLAQGDVAGAETALEELEATATLVGTQPLKAAASLARGRVAAAARPELAVEPLEDAADLFRASGVRHEAAQARLELAAALRELGRRRAADEAEAQARADLVSLGIRAPEATSGRAAPDLLTAREREVLRLLARGRSNDEIAAELVLSVRTVESHVASLYRKIGASGRTARAAATAYALSNGLG